MQLNEHDIKTLMKMTKREIIDFMLAMMKMREATIREIIKR